MLFLLLLIALLLSAYLYVEFFFHGKPDVMLDHEPGVWSACIIILWRIVRFPFAVVRKVLESDAYEVLERYPDRLYETLRAGLLADEAPRPLKSEFIYDGKCLLQQEFRVGSALMGDAKEAGVPFPSYVASKVPDPVGAAAETLSRAWGILDRALPEYVAHPQLFQLGLHKIITPDTAHGFCQTFRRPDRLFWTFFSRYCDNAYRAKAAVENQVCEYGSRAHFARLFADTQFEKIFTGNVPITIPQHLRFQGTWIVAPQGRGKTTLLSHLLSHDLLAVAQDRASIILMDSSEELTGHVRKLKLFAPGQLLDGRLVIIDPAEDLALNPLDLRTTPTQAVSLLRYLFEALLPLELTGKQGVLFSRVLLAMQEIPDANFQTFRDFLVDWRPFEPLIHKLPPEDARFFLNGEFDTSNWSGTRNEITNRIDGLMLEIPLLRGMFRATKTLFRLGEAMDSGKVIIINNSSERLGRGQVFFSRFFITLILLEAYRRTHRRDEDKLPCYVYIDECDKVISDDANTNELISKCRKHKIGLVLAHQKLADIHSKQVEAALKDCGVMFASPQAEAPSLASLFMTSDHALRRLQEGQFALIMRNMMKPLIVDVPNKHVSTWPKMSAEEYKAVNGTMRQYHYEAASQEREQPFAAGDEPSTGPEGWER